MLCKNEAELYKLKLSDAGTLAVKTLITVSI